MHNEMHTEIQSEILPEMRARTHMERSTWKRGDPIIECGNS